MALRRALLGLALATVTFGGAACGSTPSKTDCEKLRDHLIDLEAAASGAEQKADSAAQKKKVSDALKLDFCLEDLSVEQVKCGLKARSLDELATACDKT
jgi:hypothetical protein